MKERKKHAVRKTCRTAIIVGKDFTSINKEKVV